MLDAQQRGDRRISRASRRHAARARRPSTADDRRRSPTRDGKRHFVWAITWLARTCRSPSVRDRSRRAARRLRPTGRRRSTRGSADFDHPAIHRDFYWDLANGARDRRRQRSRSIDDDALSARDRRGSSREFDRRRRAAARASAAERAIHGDLNDHNILVGGGDDRRAREQRVTGIVDFGDMVHSYRVGDLAIAIAYAMLGARRSARRRRATWCADIANALRSTTTSSRRCSAWSRCACARARASPPNRQRAAAGQRVSRREPVGDSARCCPCSRAFRSGSPRRSLRDARGRRSVAGVERASRLSASDATFAPVLGIDLAHGAVDRARPEHRESAAERRRAREHRAGADGARVRRDARRRRAASSIGRYDEPRLLYVAPAFALGPRPTDEHRTIHIGLDLFVPTRERRSSRRSTASSTPSPTTRRRRTTVR